jgi:hypothetical protein
VEGKLPRWVIHNQDLSHKGVGFKWIMDGCIGECWGLHDPRSSNSNTTLAKELFIDLVR